MKISAKVTWKGSKGFNHTNKQILLFVTSSYSLFPEFIISTLLKLFLPINPFLILAQFSIIVKKTIFKMCGSNYEQKLNI